MRITLDFSLLLPPVSFVKSLCTKGGVMRNERGKCIKGKRAILPVINSMAHGYGLYMLCRAGMSGGAVQFPCTFNDLADSVTAVSYTHLTLPTRVAV